MEVGGRQGMSTTGLRQWTERQKAGMAVKSRGPSPFSSHRTSHKQTPIHFSLLKMLLTKGMELRDGDESQRRLRRRSSFRKMTALPRRAVASLTQWRTRDGSAAVDELDEEDGGGSQTLLEERPVRAPRHTASLFFKQGGARRSPEEEEESLL